MVGQNSRQALYRLSQTFLYVFRWNEDYILKGENLSEIPSIRSFDHFIYNYLKFC